MRGKNIKPHFPSSIKFAVWGQFGEILHSFVGKETGKATPDLASETLLPEMMELLWREHFYWEQASPRAPSPPPEGSDTPRLTGPDCWLPRPRPVSHTACGLALEEKESVSEHMHEATSATSKPLPLEFTMKSSLIYTLLNLCNDVQISLKYGCHGTRAAR